MSPRALPEPGKARRDNLQFLHAWVRVEQSIGKKQLSIVPKSSK